MSQNLHYSAENHLYLQNIDLHKIASQNEDQGPIYVYSEHLILHRILLLKSRLTQALSNFSIHYAVKANTHPQILKLFLDQGCGADVVSFGEMKKCLAAGFAGQKIIFSGVGKTVSEISQAIDHNVEQFNVESLSELKRIEQIAAAKNKKVDVVLRLNPDVDPKTHPYISTGFKENKFGIDEISLKECLPFLKKSQHLNFMGLSCHIGSQLQDLSSIAAAIDKLKEIYLDIKSQGFALKKLDVGGGLGIFYDQEVDQDELLLKKYADILAAKLQNFEAQIQLEPGRFLVARAGVLLTQVQYIKTTPHKTFVILNSGMHHLIRPALYNAYHRVLPVLKRLGSPMTADFVGPVCESSDFFAKDRSIAPLQEGDWLAIGEAGAYGFSMVSLYNSFDLPKEIFI